jgi:O-antigen/teichoic acid export membrane protein
VTLATLQGTAKALLRGRSGFAAVVQTGLTTAFVFGINVATGILSARFLGPDGRGELSALLLAPQLLAFLFAFGLPVAIVVKAKQRPDEAAELLGAALVLSVVFGALGSLVGFVLVPFLLDKYDEHVVAIARALLVFAALGVVSGVEFSALQLRDRFIAYNRMRYWQSAFVLFGLVSLAVLGSFTSVTGASVYLFAALPFFVWNTFWLLREFKPTLAGFAGHARGLLSYGVKVHGIEATNSLLGQLDKMILVAIFAPAVFGVYVVAFNLSRMILTFSGAALPVLLPRTAGKPASEVLATTGRASSAVTILSVAAVVGFALFGSLILGLLYGAEFRSGYWVLVILSVEAALTSTTSILQQPYLAMSKPGTVAIFQMVSLCIAVLSILTLTVSLGAEGAALGLLVATATRLSLTYAGYRRLLGIAAPKMVPAWNDCVSLVSRLRGA